MARRSKRGKKSADAAAAAVVDDDDDVIIVEPPAIVKKTIAKRPKEPSIPVLPLAPPPTRSRAQKRVTQVQKEPQNPVTGAPSLGADEPMDSEVQSTHQLDPPPPPPAPEVVELQQKLLKMEDKFQRACRIAREEQLRAERAEQLLDKKHGIVAEKKKTEDAQKAQIDKLKKELAAVSAQLKTSKAKQVDSSNLVKANEVLHKEAAELRRVCRNGYAENQELKNRIGLLTYQLDVAQDRAGADRARIDQLSYRLSQYDHWTAQQNEYWHNNDRPHW